MSHHAIAAELVVIGGGLSGVCAAIAAARNDAKVILVQDRSVLGGNASSEVKMHVVGADCHGSRTGARESGIIEELKLEDAARNPHRSYSQWDLLLYEKVMAEPNITLLLDTDCIGCTVETRDDGRRITAVHAVRNSTEDRFTLTAEFFADCSGDGRVGFEAGADFTIGREGRADYGESLGVSVADRCTLGSSILFTARRYDTAQPFQAPGWVRSFAKADFKHRPIKSYEYGYWWFEWGGHLDTLKDNAAIRHELLRIALGIWNYVKNSGEHPDSANWALEWVGAVPGKRESRRFFGPHVLTENDITSGRIFEDQVAYGGWWLDLHPPRGVDAVDEQPCEQHHFPYLYTIPLRCLYSRNVANLFIGGRMISATHVAFASTRVMATCAVVGQAIGTAAAIACHRLRNRNGPVDERPVERSAGESIPIGGSSTTNCIVRTTAVSGPARIAEIFDRTGISELQQKLLQDDAFLPGLRNLHTGDLARKATVRATSETATCRARQVTDGVTRELVPHLGLWADGGSHRWESTGLPAVLELTWPESQCIQEIHLTFDSGFHRELILSASDSATRKTVRGPQPEMVRDYDIQLDGRVVLKVSDNFLRKRVHRLPAAMPARSLQLLVKATHGVPMASVFEIRVYA